MNNTELNDVVQVILNTRDFCGNEREALLDWQDENRRLTPEERASVWEAVEWHWRNAQAHIADLRRRAYADIESEL
jgi:hypothetical protein